MDPKQQALNNKQKERQQRGSDFQEELRRSWREIPNIWQLNIKDGGGGTRPADRIILTQDINILGELKRTASRKFRLDYLRPNQVRGLIDFDQVIAHNYGLVFISFHNPGKQLDKAYAFRLITALQFMKKRDQLHIDLEDFEAGNVPAVYMPLLNRSERIYDLKGVMECFKSL